MKNHKTWVEPLARFGYGARGAVYLIIGGVTMYATIFGGKTTDSKSALRTLLEQPFGQVLLGAVVVGLLGYVTWRLIQSIGDTDKHGTDAKGLAVRGGLLASAVTYTFLAIYAMSLLGFSLTGGGDSGGGGLHQKLAGFIGLTWASVILAVTFTGVAIAHFVKVAKEGYAKHYDADSDVMRFVHPIAKTGLAARGITLLVIAYLFASKLFGGSAESSGTPGLEAALSFIRDLPAGTVLLFIVGLGLVLFALYSITEAIWRQINVEDA